MEATLWAVATTRGSFCCVWYSGRSPFSCAPLSPPLRPPGFRVRRQPPLLAGELRRMRRRGPWAPGNWRPPPRRTAGVHRAWPYAPRRPAAGVDLAPPEQRRARARPGVRAARSGAAPRASASTWAASRSVPSRSRSRPSHECALLRARAPPPSRRRRGHARDGARALVCVHSAPRLTAVSGLFEERSSCSGAQHSDRRRPRQCAHAHATARPTGTNKILARAYPPYLEESPVVEACASLPSRRAGRQKSRTRWPRKQ